MICFDREFPESARLLMLNGAEIILTPNVLSGSSNNVIAAPGTAFCDHSRL